MRNLTPLFCKLAMERAASLPSCDRADLYEFAAQLFNMDGYPEYASAASLAAKDLRNAEAAQTHFEALLSSACDEN